MKIAVIFGGQIRTGVQTSKSVFDFLGEYLPHCDFFIHTWDITTYKNGDYHNSHSPEFDWDAIKLKEEYLNEFLEIYKPLKYEVTPFLKFREEIEHSPDYLMPAWAYSFWKANELKKEYENENNFKYDYVIKLRPDILLHPNRRLSQDIEMYKSELDNGEFYIENLIRDWNIDSHTIDDVYFLSNSNVSGCETIHTSNNKFNIVFFSIIRRIQKLKTF